MILYLKSMEAIQKTFAVLELFLSTKDEMSLSELSQLSGINKTTVSRITSTLVKLGYLSQREKRGKYSLGMRFLDFSGFIKTRIRIRDIAISYLNRLSRLLGESVILTIWDGKEAIIHESFHANHFLQVVPDEGTRIPLHSTAVGKIIMAGMTEEEFRAYFNGRTLERTTPNTITDLDTIKQHTLIVQQEGVASEYEEYAAGVSGVAVGLRNNRGKTIGAVGVLGPSARLTPERIGEITPAVCNCAGEISRKLGYQGKPAALAVR